METPVEREGEKTRNRLKRGLVHVPRGWGCYGWLVLRGHPDV